MIAILTANMKLMLSTFPLRRAQCRRSNKHILMMIDEIFWQRVHILVCGSTHFSALHRLTSAPSSRDEAKQSFTMINLFETHNHQIKIC